MYMFSVVIPAFNASSEIKNTLDSVFNQKFTNYEVVIVDDCSDDSEELKLVIEHYQSKYDNLKCFYSKVKLNGSGARNKGVEISSGKYIALLDADDTWHEDKLLRYNEEICRLDKKDIIFYSKLNVMQDGCKIKEMPVRPYVVSKETIASYLFGVAGFIQTSTIVVHRDTYLKVKFNEGFIRHQDYDFCIRADQIGLYFHFIPELLSNYNIRGRSTAKNKGESVKFSSWWLLQMKPYLNKKDVRVYKAFKLTHKLKSDGNGIMSIINFGLFFMGSSYLAKKDFFIYILRRIKNG